MKRFLFLFILLSYFVNSRELFASTFSHKDINEKINTTISSLMQRDHISGMAVALVNHGKSIIYIFGCTKNNPHLAITENTMFEIGSVTKLFTTLLFSEDLQNHKLAPTSKITKYLTHYSQNPYLGLINLEQLAVHTSQLPFNEPTTIKNKQQLNYYLLHWKPKHPSQLRWAYSNIGIGLLGEVITSESHLSLNKLMENNIFLPLDMKRTYIFTRTDTDHLLDYFPAAWAAKSNIKDMSHFLNAAIGLSNTPKDILTAMQLAQTPRIQVGDMEQAFAWQVYSLDNKQRLLNIPNHKFIPKSIPAKELTKYQQHYNPHALIDKTGSTQNYSSYIAVIPDESSGIVMLLNTHISHSDMINAGREILFAAAYSLPK